VGNFVLDASGSGYGPVARSCEHDNEPSGSIKAGHFLTGWGTISSPRRTLFPGVNSLVARFEVTITCNLYTVRELGVCLM